MTLNLYLFVAAYTSRSVYELESQIDGTAKSICTEYSAQPVKISNISSFHFRTFFQRLVRAPDEWAIAELYELSFTFSQEVDKDGFREDFMDCLITNLSDFIDSSAGLIVLPHYRGDLNTPWYDIRLFELNRYKEDLESDPKYRYLDCLIDHGKGEEMNMTVQALRLLQVARF